MTRTTIWAAVIAVIGVLSALSAEATLTGSYDWVAYNNATAGAPVFSSFAPTVPNVTDFTYDTATEPGNTSHRMFSGGSPVAGNVGTLVKFADGTPTPVQYTGSIDPATTWYGASNRNVFGQPLVPGTVAHDNFGDVVGTNYEHNGGFQADNGYAFQTLTFSNLDPTKVYSFAAISTQIEWANRGTGGVAKVLLVNDDVASGGFVNNSTPSAFLSTGGVVGGSYKITDASGTALAHNFANLVAEWDYVNAALGTDGADYAFLSGHSDDMVRFDEISPGPDGTFSLLVETFMSGRLDGATDTTLAGSNESVGIDFFALGQAGGDSGGELEEGSSEGEGGSPVPEPSAIALAALSLVGLGFMRGRRMTGSQRESRSDR